MKLKKLISIILMSVMAVGMMCGCGKSDKGQSVSDNRNTTTDSATTDSATTDSTTTDDSAPSAEKGKTLVVYYSATGNTKSVAEKIAGAANADLFEIRPEEPYTGDDLDWTDNKSRVSREHDDESLRNVKLVSATVDNWDSYDVVYIGYPIWWGIAAWPVDGFVKANDFTGKTVIPFCTAASSGIGDSGNLLKKEAGTGNWLDGERFRGNASVSDISSWIDSLGL